MAELTSNIELKKPLENEFVNINVLNANMDKIDQSLGPINDLPTRAGNVADAISEIYDHMTDRPSNQLTLTQGVQVVQGGDLPAILHPTMQGRTLVNLLGRDGNFESLNPWDLTTQAPVLSATQVKYGINSLKVTTNNGNCYAQKDYLYTLDRTRQYFFAGWVYVESYTNISGGGLQISLRDYGTLNTRYNIAVDTTKIGQWQFIWGVVPQNNTLVGAGFRILVGAVGTTSAVAYIDGVRLYEVSATEHNALTSMTIDQIDTTYPYVDNMKHVNAVYIENKGKNLLPPFSEWVPFDNSASVRYEVSDSSTVRMYGIGMTGTIVSPLIPVVPGQSYTISGREVYSANSYFDIIFCDKNGVVIGLGVDGLSTGATKATGVAPPNAAYVKGRVITLAGATSGSFLVTKPMLNVGLEALPFEPQKPSYLYLPDCNLRSNVDGSVADRLYTDGQGKPRVMRQFREVVLDGSLAWAINQDRTGYKEVKASLGSPQFIGNNEANLRGVKYDGKILNSTGSTGAAIDNIGIDVGTMIIYISIADTDSGWGESYTPTVDEIRAYFWGWKLYDNTLPLSDTSTYVRTDGLEKRWAYKNKSGTWVTGRQSPGDSLPSDWIGSPYRLMYQLAQSVDEQVSYEGSLMLHEGDNQVEVGTGIVVREAVTAYLTAPYMFLNPVVAGYTTKRRTRKMISAYLQGDKDGKWAVNVITGEASIVTAGKEQYRTTTLENVYGPYSVTYLALDTYTLGIAPQTISAEYAPNIRESVESLVREVVEARTETSVLASTKAQKQQPQWIEAALLSDWTGFLRYLRNDEGYVTLTFALTVGITALNTIVCRLPFEYRSANNTAFTTFNNNTGSTGLGLGVNSTLGGVAVTGSTNFSTGHIIYGTVTYKGR